jgi:hypothetical protein
MKPGDLVKTKFDHRIGLFMRYMSYKELIKPHYEAYNELLASGGDGTEALWAEVLWPIDGLMFEQIRDIIIIFPLPNINAAQEQ